MAEPIQTGVVAIDVTLGPSTIRDDIKGKLAAAFDAPVNAKFTKTQVQTALKLALKDKNPLVVDVHGKFSRPQLAAALKTATVGKKPLVVDVHARLISGGLRTQVASQAKAINALELRQANASELIAKRSEASKTRITLAGEEARKTLRAKNAIDQLRAAEREARQDQALKNRLAAQQDAFDKRVQFNAIRQQQKLAAIRNKPFGEVLGTELGRASGSLRQFDQVSTRILKTSLTAFTVWSLGVTAAFGAVAAAGIATYAKLEISAARAGALVASDKFNESLLKNGKGITNFAGVAESAQKRIIAASSKVALDTLFSPTEVTEGTKALLQAGQKIPEALANIGPAAQFAQINEMDLAETTKGLAAGLASAGLTSKDSGKLLDEFSFVAQNALGDAGDYMTAFANKAAASAKAFGYSNEETLTLLTLLGQAGTLGEEAGTQANIVFRELARGAGRAGDAWKKYGIDANGSLNEQLIKIGELAGEVRKQKGRAGVAGLAEELGLTYKSISSILQVLPQAQKMGLSGLNKLTVSIGKSAGAVERQSDVLRKTIAFQWDNLIDTFRVGFASFGQAASKEVTSLFDAFAGSDGLLAKATPRIMEFGREFGKVVGRVGEFVQTKAFASGIRTLVESVQIAIHGTADAVRAFSSAFDKQGEAQSSFESFADAIKAFSTVSARVLPVVAGYIGKVINFAIEHKDSFEFFAKAALSLFIFNKAFQLILAPMFAISKTVRVLAIAIGAEGGAGLVGRLGSLTGGLSLTAGSLVKLGLRVTGFGILAVAAFDFIKGAVEGFMGTLGGSEGVGSALGDATGAVVGLGQSISDLVAPISAFVRGSGKAFGITLGNSVRLASELVALMAQLAHGDVEAAGKTSNAIGETVFYTLEDLGALIAPFKGDFLGDASTSLDKFVRTALAADAEAVRFDGAMKRLAPSADLVRSALGMLDVAATSTAGNLAAGFLNAQPALDFTAAAGGFQVNMDAVKNSADAAAQAARQAFGQAQIDIINMLTQTLAAGETLSIEAQGIATGLTYKAPGQRNFIQIGIQRDARAKAAAATKRRAKAAAEAKAKIFEQLTPSTSKATKAPKGPSVAEQQRALPDLNAAADARAAALTIVQRRRQTDALIARIDKAGAKGYKGTRGELALLKLAMPQLDKALELQKTKVQGLDDALQGLRNTQLLGTKAFSDAAFASDQAVKGLQLQRLDLIAAGNSDGSQVVKALDKQIADLQASAERQSLVESLQLDPLKKKLDETFNPVKELSFAEITKQFADLTAQQATANASLTDQTRIQKELADSVGLTGDHFTKVDEAARASIQAIADAGAAAARAAESFGGAAASAGTAAKQVDKYADAASSITDSGAVVDKSLKQVNSRLDDLAPRFSAAGARVVTYFTKGVNFASLGVLRPALARITGEMVTSLRTPIAPATDAGVAIMHGLFVGLVQGFGHVDMRVDSPAWFLHVFIPDWIKKNKGPVEYDATILVPAGEAIMTGFGKGLRTGFAGIQDFVKEVGPSIGEYVSGDLFNDRTAKVMVDIATGKAPDIEAAFGDLRPQPVDFLGGTLPLGPVDPSLSFLHASKSLLDTTRMAQQVASLFGMTITAITGGQHAVGSDHYKGLAADLSNSGGSDFDPSSMTSGMTAMFQSLLPFVGSAFGQLIYDGHIVGRHAGPISNPPHYAHVHLGFNPASGFSIGSGQIGEPMALPTPTEQGPMPSNVLRFPGASLAVDQALAKAAAKNHLSNLLLGAVAFQESSFRPGIVSRDGGYGLMQLTDSSYIKRAKALGNIFDPFINAEIGAEVLREKIRDNGGTLRGGLRGYNGSSAYPDIIFAHMERFRKLFGGAREKGGPVSKGKTYLVGEKGPELWTAERNGSIIPAGPTAAIMGQQQGGYVDNRKYEIHTKVQDPNSLLALIKQRDRQKMAKVRVSR